MRFYNQAANAQEFGREPDRWYFACEVCGNCGTFHSAIDDALRQAMDHLKFNHRGYE